MNNPLQKNRLVSDDPQETTPGDSRPAQVRRTLSVLALLLATALLFSYLGAYAVTNALVATDMMLRWPAGADPRPRLLLWGFLALMGCFGTCGIVARTLSRRQLRRIDAMVEEA